MILDNKEEECTSCGGTGKKPSMKKICVACGGTGRDPGSYLVPDKLQEHHEATHGTKKAPCKACDGKGSYKDEIICYSCFGSGKKKKY